MRAAVYYETGGPEVFRYEEVPDPALRPGGVIVEVGPSASRAATCCTARAG